MEERVNIIYKLSCVKMLAARQGFSCSCINDLVNKFNVGDLSLVARPRRIDYKEDRWTCNASLIASPSRNGRTKNDR